MEGLDLSTVWKLVMNNTQSSSNSNGSLSNSALTDIAKNIVTNMVASKAGASANASASKSNSSSIDYIAIAQQLMSLYNQYKGSSNKTEVAAASNVKQISDIVGAMGGDKGSMISAGLNMLGKLFGK